MLKKTITYTDYDGNKRTEDFLFNLNKAEMIKFMTTTGEYTLDKVIEKLSKERNGKKIMEIFESLLKLSYGEKSLDGRRFIKSDEIWENFESTEAYSTLFVELVSDAKKASSFINAVIPKDVAEEIAKELSKNPDAIPPEIKDYMALDSEIVEVEETNIKPV